jgi:hypothetical protein
MMIESFYTFLFCFAFIFILLFFLLSKNARQYLQTFKTEPFVKKYKKITKSSIHPLLMSLNGKLTFCLSNYFIKYLSHGPSVKTEVSNLGYLATPNPGTYSGTSSYRYVGSLE